MEIVIQVNGEPDLTAVVGGELSFYNPETDEYEVRSKTLGDLVAEKLADKMYSAYGNEQRGEMWKRIAEDRAKIVRERVEPLVVKALSEEIYETNVYGERVGNKVITLRELIVTEAMKALTKTGTRYDSKASLLEQVISKEVGSALTVELNQAVAGAKTEMVKAVRAKAAEFLTEEVLARKTR